MLLAHPCDLFSFILKLNYEKLFFIRRELPDLCKKENFDVLPKEMGAVPVTTAIFF